MKLNRLFVSMLAIAVTVASCEKPDTVSPEPEEPVEVANGTEESPYLIKTVEDLSAMREKAESGKITYFRLENDIDMAEVTNWVPVNYEEPFARQIHFDGNNKTISNFAPKTWNDGDIVATYPSFFGVLWGSCKNLTIKNAVITDAASSAGILGGYVGTIEKPASVTNVSVQGTISAKTYRIGGMAGVAYDATFTDCASDVTITTESSDAGGFVGYVQGTSSFKGCDAKAVIVSTAFEKCRCGGFIGWNRSVKTDIEDCHVLEGTSITSAAERTEAKITSFGGFIGYADRDLNKETEPDGVGTVLNIKNSSAKANITAGEWAQINSCFIGTVGYESTITIEDSFAEGTVDAGQNYSGGLVARIQNPGTRTIKNSYFKGKVKGRAGIGGLVGAVEGGALVVSKSYAEATVNNTQNNIGGLVGLVTTSLEMSDCYFDGAVNGSGYVGGVVGGVQAAATKLDIARTSAKGTVTANGNYAGGFIGAAQGVEQKIDNCWSSASVTAVNAKQVGGLVGTATSAITITNSFASGDIVTKTVGAGIIGRVGAENSTISNCIAWNAKVESTAASSTGAIIGSLEKSGSYSKCIRKNDMVVTIASAAQTLADQDDMTTVSSTCAYHGKAAAAGATVSSVAKTLGWSETVWDLSGTLPVLK